MRLRYTLAPPYFYARHFFRMFSGPSVPGAFRILIFHDVLETQYDALKRLLDCLLEECGVITPAQAEARLNGGNVLSDGGKIPCLLSFDDGFKSNALVASRVLHSYGIKAIFFVCPGIVDMEQTEQRQAIARYIFDGKLQAQALPESMSLMSWRDIKALADQGHTIGSHTLHHARLSELTQAERLKEVVNSADRLAEVLGVSARWIAYPFGDLGSIDANSMEIIRKKYEFCCSGLRGINVPNTSRWALLRQPMDLDAPLLYQRLAASGGLDFLYGKPVRALGSL